MIGRLRILAGLLVLMPALPACTGAVPGATPPASSFAQPTQRAPTATPPSTPGPAIRASSTPFSSPTPFDPVVEAALPAEIGGVATRRWSHPASDYATGDMCGIWVCPGEMSAFIGALGAAGPDLRVGIALGGVPAMVIAFRAPGLSGQTLFETWIKALKPKTTDPVSVSGKTVTFALYNVFLAPSSSEYLYVTGDVLYSVRFQPAVDWLRELPPPTPPEVTAAVDALP